MRQFENVFGFYSLHLDKFDLSKYSIGVSKAPLLGEAVKRGVGVSPTFFEFKETNFREPKHLEVLINIVGISIKVVFLEDERT